MSIALTMKNGNTDPRYRKTQNGVVYTNTAGAKRQTASNLLNWQLDNNPLNWGWELLGWLDDYQPMYHQAGVQLTRLSPQCWHVAKLGEREGQVYGGSAKLVTGYLWALGLPVVLKQI